MTDTNKQKVRDSYKCIWCGGNLMDGKHDFFRYSYVYMVSCPDFPISQDPILLAASMMPGIKYTKKITD